MVDCSINRLLYQHTVALLGFLMDAFEMNVMLAQHRSSSAHKEVDSIQHHRRTMHAIFLAVQQQTHTVQIAEYKPYILRSNATVSGKPLHLLHADNELSAEQLCLVSILQRQLSCDFIEQTYFRANILL